MTTVPGGLYPAPVVPFSAKSDFIADASAYSPCVKPPHYVHSWVDALTPAIVRRFEVVAKEAPLPMLIGAGGGIGTIPAAYYKAAFNMLGLPGGHLRELVPSLTPADEAAVCDLLVRYGALDG